MLGICIRPSRQMLWRDLSELGRIPIRTGEHTVYLRDIGTIEDSADLTTGYALVNGRRAVYILATKRADASTMEVINQIRRSLPAMQKELPDDIRVSFEFDQSPYVTRAISSLSTEGLLGAALTGLMVLVFLRDWRSALVVILNIPLALLFAVTGLWLTGQTINLMTLGGLGAGGGDSGGRGDGGDREHSQATESHWFCRTGGLAWQSADGGAATAGSAVHAGGVPSDILHAGSSSRTVRSAGTGSDFFDDWFVSAVQYAGARPVCLAAACRAQRRRRRDCRAWWATCSSTAATGRR